jgi:hypothetical protein
VGRDTDEHEDSGANDGADAKAGQLQRAQHSTEPLFAVYFIEQIFERFPDHQVRQQVPPQAAA